MLAALAAPSAEGAYYAALALAEIAKSADEAARSEVGAGEAALIRALERDSEGDSVAAHCAHALGALGSARAIAALGELAKRNSEAGDVALTLLNSISVRR